MKDIQQQLNEPGHQKEKKAFNNARRGAMIHPSRVEPDKKKEAGKRARLRQNLKKELEE